MAVYTKISKQEMQNLLAKGYGLDIAQVNPVAQGIENSIYQVRDVSGSTFAFVIFETLPLSLVESYCEQLARLEQSLVGSNASCVSVPAGIARVPSAQDQPKYTLEVFDQATSQHKPAVLQPWISGEHLDPSEKACAQLGEFLGGLSQIQPPASTKLAMQIPQSNSLIPVDQHLYRIALVEQELKHYEKKVQGAFYKMKHQCQEVIDAHGSFSYGLVHGDLFADNALFNGQGLVGVIDFFNASWSPRLMDLAICLMDWALVDGQLNQPKLRALVQGFLKNCEPVSKIELDFWPDLVRLAAFRFWCTRQEYVKACEIRNISPVAHRSPMFCADVYALVSQQESVLRQVWQN